MATLTTASLPFPKIFGYSGARAGGVFLSLKKWNGPTRTYGLTTSNEISEGEAKLRHGATSQQGQKPPAGVQPSISRGFKRFVFHFYPEKTHGMFFYAEPKNTSVLSQKSKQHWGTLRNLKKHSHETQTVGTSECRFAFDHRWKLIIKLIPSVLAH